MSKPEPHEPKRSYVRGLGVYPVIILFVSLVVFASSFILMSSDLAADSKSRGFFGLIAGYLVVSVCLYFWQNRRAEEIRSSTGSGEHVESKLLVFDEAHEFFRGTLKLPDMFRLVSSRIEELIPFQTSALFLLDKAGERLYAAECTGANCEGLAGLKMRTDEGLVGKCFTNAEVTIGADFVARIKGPPGAAKSNKSAVAIPLLQDGEVFGVLVLYLFSELKAASTDLSLFEAIGTRAAPLILSSVALDHSISNALTDPTTELPNERAFFLILENQLAESHRKRDERPLTVLAIDIKNFEEINSKYGHAAGDRVLNFVARTVREQLRDMDFLSRASHDEFLTILPTAAERVALDIIERIRTAFFGNSMYLTDNDSVQIDVNFGWASFWRDGETAEQLLNIARLRKIQSKSSDPQKVVWFPKELLN